MFYSLIDKGLDLILYPKSRVIWPLRVSIPKGFQESGNNKPYVFNFKFLRA